MSHDGVILIYTKLCGPMEKASWPTIRPCPTGWRPLFWYNCQWKIFRKVGIKSIREHIKQTYRQPRG